MQGKATGSSSEKGRYIILISIHGLIRGEHLELGRDSDTGGQTLYVVELARALARHPDVWRVDLLTRQVIDPKVDDDYAQPLEPLGDKAYIVRLPCGPRRYLRKEVLWPYLDGFTDAALQHVRRIGRLPDFVHSHYADAGFVASRLTALLGVPMVHTGHSLGWPKRERLLEQGVREEQIEQHYNLSQRIEAEEMALENAQLVVASTRQEVEQQYARYDNYQPKRMEVIPPGTDLTRFRPPKQRERWPPIWEELQRFLRHPKKPMILALSRPDERKNILTLVEAYAMHPTLRDLANLVIVAGNRDDISHMERGPKTVLTNLLMCIDRHDLYGHIAYPKHHDDTDVPDLYRLAARLKGVFVNPALTEPFGLTLIEAAASGVPILATHDGGPRDIIRHCRNGYLIDPLKPKRMARRLEQMLIDPEQWGQWSQNGLKGVHKHYSWDSHVEKYLKAVRRTSKGKYRPQHAWGPSSRMPTIDRLIVCALDNVLMGDEEAQQELVSRLEKSGEHIGFGVATGRTLDSAMKLIKASALPMPDVLITSVGSEIHYGHRMVHDQAWLRHIDFRWEPDKLRDAMKQFKGMKLQPKTEQHPYKISYFIDSRKGPSRREVVRHLRKLDLHANVLFSRNMFVDLLPIRASKGTALRHVSVRWNIPPEKILIAGSCGNDADVLSGNTLGVVVGNHSDEIERLRGWPRVYFAEGEHAWGILEGINYYDFLGVIHIPNDEYEEA
ncbi:HAD-IIB family hydrolase [Thiohalobacter thiocyanaticus]|nr:HAD-IIB family hydrolase [Thiohalobacter thiocyanaticus]